MKLLRAAVLLAILCPHKEVWCQSVALEIAANSEAAKAGIQAGDVIVRWRRGADGGELRNPYELALLEIETAGGSAVTLVGMRGRFEQAWTLNAMPWGLTITAPSVDGHAPASYLDGQRLAGAGQPAAAATFWERAALQAKGIEAVWLLSRAGEVYASARQGENSDRAFAAALQQSPEESAVRIQLERMWADACYQRNAWDQAKPHYDKALAEAERSESRGAQATVLWEIGRMFTDRRQPQQAPQYLRRALQIRQELAPDSVPVAQVVNSLGRAYLTAGDFKQAGQYFEQSLALFEKLAPGSAPMAAALQNLGIVALDLDQLEPAQKYFERSLAITVKLAPNGVLWANTATSLAQIARMRGDVGLAQQYLDQVLAIRRKMQPDSLFLSSALNGLGNLHEQRGDLALADSEFREALAINVKLAPDSREVAGTLENLGGLAQVRGDWDLALDDLRQSVAVWEKFAPGSVFWARALADYAQVLEHFGKYDEAEQQYRTVLKSLEEQKVGAASIARVREALGEVQERRGQGRLAGESYENAFAVLNRELPGSLGAAGAALHIAELARAEGQWERAGSYYQQSLSIAEGVAPDGEYVARSLHGLALAAQHRGQKDEAAVFFDRSLWTLESGALKAGGSEQSQAEQRAGYAPFYQDYLLFLTAANRLGDAFAVLERSRARALLNLLAERDFESKDVPADLDLERRKNAADYDRAQNEIEELSPERDKVALAALQARLHELTADRANIIEKIKRGSPHYAELRYPKPLNLEEAQAALDSGSVLASFAVTPQRTYLFVVRPKGAQQAISAFIIPVTEAALREKVRGFRDAIGARTFSSQATVAQEGRALYDLLLRPADSALISAKRVLIVPDGPLDSLPFASLRRTPNELLIQWKPLHTALSVTLYDQLKRDRRPDSSYRFTVAAFGDARYGAESASPQSFPGNGELRSALYGSDLRPLKFSRAEVEQIAALYPEKTELFLGPEATEERAKSLGTDVRYIHFSVHGLVDKDFPLNSALVLTRPAELESGKDNGLLQAWELYAGVRWDADLVVLSACKSGLGQELAGEGMFGLVRAVQYAGARSVIATLWSVDDRPSQILMTAFYRHLREGRSKDEALRTAQLELMTTKAWASPLYWAGFVLSGDWQ
jgi:CHAT domain-containing protein/tetratricopeptide (TPR) repeat protein